MSLFGPKVAPLPMGPFRCILSDPPWLFEGWSELGEGKSAQNHYDCMTLDELCDMRVSDVAADDAILFLWCTWPTIFSAERLIKAWGFNYSGLAWEWIKRNPATGKYAFGPGYGTRKNLEPCLMARRGQPKLLNHSTRDFLYAPRREHSRKPSEQYDVIEKLCAGPRLELFARAPRDGWTVWGNQADKFPEDQGGAA